ncbi:ORF21 protein [Metarhizium brunneum]
MTLKRKRSEPELCSSPSSCSSIFSSPPSNSAIDVNPQAFYNMPAAHLNSRTMKRFRNNRPSEEIVHQHTLNLLFSAQQQQSQTVRETGFQPLPQTGSASEPRKQQSLHRFWSINSAPTPVSESTVEQPALAPTSCEDCGAGLGPGGNAHDMAVDDLTADNTTCGACGKHVCFSCSVSNLGEEKRCLCCAGRKAFGNIGWPNMGLSLC